MRTAALFAMVWLSGAAVALALVMLNDYLARQRRRLPAATRRAIRRERAAARLELPYLYTDDPRDTEDIAP